MSIYSSGGLWAPYQMDTGVKAVQPEELKAHLNTAITNAYPTCRVKHSKLVVWLMYWRSCYDRLIDDFRSDVDEMRELMSERYGATVRDVCFNESESYDTRLRKLSQTFGLMIRNSSEEEVHLVFYSGHGVTGKANNDQVIFYPTSSCKEKDEGVCFPDVVREFQNAAARVLYVLGCGYATAVDNTAKYELLAAAPATKQTPASSKGMSFTQAVCKALKGSAKPFTAAQLHARITNDSMAKFGTCHLPARPIHVVTDPEMESIMLHPQVQDDYDEPTPLFPSWSPSLKWKARFEVTVHATPGSKGTVRDWLGEFLPRAPGTVEVQAVYEMDYLCGLTLCVPIEVGNMLQARPGYTFDGDVCSSNLLLKDTKGRKKSPEDDLQRRWQDLQKKTKDFECPAQTESMEARLAKLERQVQQLQKPNERGPFDWGL